MNLLCRHCGALHWSAERISTSTIASPQWESCCRRGDVILPGIQTPPTFLRNLFELNNPQANHFRQHIRQYNAAFAFTSLGCQLDNRVRQTTGPMSFQIHGELYHLQGPLEVDGPQLPMYAQLYIYDPQTALNIRQTRNEGLQATILRDLAEMFESCNPWVPRYRQAHEMLGSTNESDHIRAFIRLNPQLQMNLIQGSDRRTMNLPTGDEIAAIIPDEYSEDSYRDIILTKRDPPDGHRRLQRINQNHPAYMPLHYVLLFPQGDPGWHWALRLGSTHGPRVRERLTQRTYYRYRLHMRENEYPTLFRAGRLFQQYLVDAWAICDQNKLGWMHQNQKKLRVDLYSGLADALRREDHDRGAIGQMFVLPSSYLGGPRFMQQLFQDSMAIVRHFGKPTLFITFTANPSWTEITDELFPGQTALDRPDLVARVFHLRVKSLMEDLKKKQIFGPYEGVVRTIEYQKRGLPHLHLLLFLEAQHNFIDPVRIDRIVSAELPDPEQDPELFQVISTVMMHGPCGELNPRSACMTSRSGSHPSCSKRYPRRFADETIVQEDGYPIYRRRQDGRTHQIRHPVFSDQTLLLDNTWVVPYNPYLSRRYRAHINVEVCASVQAIKYIHKYIYKGPDRTTLEVSNSNDEISQYLSGRYIGPTEAMWQLMEYPTHEEDPPVQKLHVHATEGPSVVFEDYEGDEIPQDVRDRIESAASTLTAFFDYNRDHLEARQYLYQDFPRYFVWNQRRKTWQVRQRGFAIGRIYHCNPLAGERFYVRLLLTAVRGATSFDDLRTVDGVLHPTFQQACVALGLLEDDREWISCFNEARLISTGHSLRVLFVTALVFGSIAEPRAMWQRFKTSLSDDLQRRLEDYPNIPTELDSPREDYCLFLIQGLLAEAGRTLSFYRLPMVLGNWGHIHANPLIAQEMQYDRTHEEDAAKRLEDSLNPGQLEVFRQVINTIRNHPERAQFFLQGAAGTGKTFLYRALCHHYRAQGKIVLGVASSGIAALLLPGGRTSHSRFRIPIELDELSVCKISRQDQLSQLLRTTPLIIWDEVPMQHKHCFEAVHRTLCDIRQENSVLFGGIPMLLGGDFAQILPVVRRGNCGSTIHACIQRSFLWRHFTCLRLHHNMRIVPGLGNNEFAQWIGRLSYDATNYGRIALPPFIWTSTAEQEFLERIYPAEELWHAHQNPPFFRSRAILASRNDTVGELNQQLLEKMIGQIRTLESSDKADLNEEGSEQDQLPAEYLQSLTPASLPLAHLQLKVGCPVILLRNLYPQLGLCNGTRLIVTHIGRFALEVRILSGEFEGKMHIIPRITLNSTLLDLPFILRRKQFPVRLSFGMTINKAQGQSLQTVGVDLRQSVFTHGQLYVALSRVTNVHRLSVLLAGEGDGRTENIVWPGILLH